jgi:hypothetical protein
MDTVLAWLRLRLLGVALSIAAFITFISLITPAWMDFIFDLAMMGLIAVAAKLAKTPRKS